MADDVVVEGFLCPNCHLDLGSVQGLVDHVSSNTCTNTGISSTSSTSPSNEFALQPSCEVAFHEPNYGAFSFNYSTPSSEPGITRNLTDLFTSIRGLRTSESNIESNKLFIRLSKIVADEKLAISSPSARRAHEQQMVAWQPDREARICAACSTEFSIIRRRHHCRLCGRVICEKCCFFLHRTQACMIASAYRFLCVCLIDTPECFYYFEFKSIACRRLLISIYRFTACDAVRLLTSMSDQLGLAGQLVADSEHQSGLRYQLRICRFCHRILSERQHEIDELLELPPVAQLYERMKELMLETIDMIQAFRVTIDQLVVTDTPLDARSLKEKLIALTRMRDDIHSHFARIQKLNDRRLIIIPARSKQLTAIHPGSGTQARLQSAVARLASDFLREFLFAVPSVPSAANVERQQLVHKQQLEQQRLAAARAAAARRAPDAVAIVLSSQAASINLLQAGASLMQSNAGAAAKASAPFQPQHRRITSQPDLSSNQPLSAAPRQPPPPPAPVASATVRHVMSSSKGASTNPFEEEEFASTTSSRPVNQSRARVSGLDSRGDRSAMMSDARSESQRPADPAQTRARGLAMSAAREEPVSEAADTEFLEVLREQKTQLDAALQAARASGDEDTASALAAHLKELQVEIRNREQLQLRAAFVRDESARQRVALYSERRPAGITSSSNMASLQSDDGDPKPRSNSFAYEN